MASKSEHLTAKQKRTEHLLQEARRAAPRTIRFLTGFIMLHLVVSMILILVGLGIRILILRNANRNSTKPNDLTNIVRKSEESYGDVEGNTEPWVEVISGETRALVYHNFLDEVVEKIEKRISDVTFIPLEYGEGLQVLHYQVGQKYEPRYDYVIDEFKSKTGGQRIATVVMYLSDVDDGGETVFPAAKGNISEVPWWNELSKCGKGLSVLPKKRDALFSWNMRPGASLDSLSLHGGCPVVKGDKWSSKKCFHVHAFKV
ncbi:unnamed protein product [Arabis nemorensis]|uniref:Fe2OG dioxygenase domain-containing protein n=1 Tax=Arabis nemorensis TaxID=586526 RepID=A0A565B558_9BRAS|nr:unnamed protein product [Arabis nemorensis]